jgi:hypothetical protein
VTDYLHLQVDAGGERLDTYVAKHAPDLSRARVQQLIKTGEVCVNGTVAKPSYKVEVGDTIDVHLPAPVEPAGVKPERIPLDIIYPHLRTRSGMVAAALVLGGALGNLIDRIRLQYVIDYLDIRVWPVFNIADAAIVVGVATLLATLVVAEHTRRATPGGNPQ